MCLCRCLPVPMKVIANVLGQRRGHGFMDVSWSRWRVPTEQVPCAIGSRVPGVVSMGEIGASSFSSRQSSVNGDWLVGSGRYLWQAAALPWRKTGVQKREWGSEKQIDFHTLKASHLYSLYTGSNCSSRPCGTAYCTQMAVLLLLLLLSDPQLCHGSVNIILIGLLAPLSTLPYLPWPFELFMKATHPGLELRRSIEDAREACIFLGPQVLLVGTPTEAGGTPGWALPPPRVWCAWRDLGRLAKRPSAIILTSGKKYRDTEKEVLNLSYSYLSLSAHTLLYTGI